MSTIDAKQYMQDAQGRLVPVDAVKEVDRMRSQMVQELCERAIKVSDAVAEFKNQVFDEVDAFIELSIEKYDAKRSEKGNVTLPSFDGRYRIIVAVDEIIQFDERLIAARELIDECIREWSQGARPELVRLVEDAFRAGSDGRLSASRVLGLRRLDIKDDNWKRAMEALSDSIQVARTKRYVRFYRRTGDGEKYDQIPIG